MHALMALSLKLRGLLVFILFFSFFLYYFVASEMLFTRKILTFKNSEIFLLVKFLILKRVKALRVALI